jgi:precorrin-3B synthase
LHIAADGPLARIRLPGGLLTGSQLAVVRELAQRWGDGHVELTSRANLQLRGLTGAPAADLAARLWAAGLLPSRSHELVRNIAASPLSPPSHRAVVADLDDGLCADPELAGLPGRFLFALDDGSGDVAGGADVAAFPDGDRAAILFAGQDAGLRVRAGDVVAALLAAAHAFLDERAAQNALTGDNAGPDRDACDPGGQDVVSENAAGPAWRVRELTDGPARLAARTATALGVALLDERLNTGPLDAGPVDAGLLNAGPLNGGPVNGGPRDDAVRGTELTPSGRSPAAHGGELIGSLVQADGLVWVAALVPLGRLGPVPMKVLQEAELIVVTPARGVIVPDLPPAAAQAWLRALAEAGLDVTSGSPWSGVTACAGRPGCGKALADVRGDAEAAVHGQGRGGPLPVHWVGCARGCGSPAGAHVRAEATGDGYRVTAPGFASDVAAAESAAVVAAARRS